MIKTLTWVGLLSIVVGAFGCGETSPTVTSDVFVPADFSVPQILETEQFTLLPIQPEFAELDFAAVMQSVEQLRAKFGSEWPADDFSIEQNRHEIEIHCDQFDQRKSFTYSVFSVEQDRIMGCVYIVPDELEPGNAKVIYWIRSDERSDRLENVLQESLENWLQQTWEFPSFHIEQKKRETDLR